ncbi:MAG: hypothetical protein DRJ59_00885 [Thermoprotei archaeon]|nr:MAG: hypothetical protein DRJ59_00885 [Thermoprotei archaeon]
MRREKIGYILGPLLFILCLLHPLPGMEAAARLQGVPRIMPQLALGVLLWTATWWVTECVPLGLAALVPTLIFPLVGLVSWKTALSSFTSPIIWIFMGGFVLAKAFQVWGLDRRIALKLALFYKGKNPFINAFFVASLPVFILTMTGSITASTSIVYPIALAYLTSLGFSRGSKYAEATMLTLGQAATAGAMFLLISTPPNLIAKQVIENNLKGVTITFFDWIIIGTPHAFLGLLITWFIVFLLLKPEIKVLSKKTQLIREGKTLKPMTKGEKAVLAVFILTLTLWMLPGALLIASSFYPEIMPLAYKVKGILPEAAPAVLALFLLGLLRVDKRPLLTWRDIEEGIDWNVVFLFGGGIVLGTGLKNSGFAKWIALMLTEQTMWSLNIWTISMLSGIMAFLITYPASNTASSLIACPLAASIAIGAGINPIPPVITAALAASISSALPSTTPPMAIVYGSGYIRLWNMFKVGMVADTIRLILLLIIEPYLAVYLCQLKGLPLLLTSP